MNPLFYQIKNKRSSAHESINFTTSSLSHISSKTFKNFMVAPQLGLRHLVHGLAETGQKHCFDQKTILAPRFSLRPQST